MRRPVISVVFGCGVGGGRPVPRGRGGAWGSMSGSGDKVFRWRFSTIALTPGGGGGGGVRRHATLEVVSDDGEIRGCGVLV